MADWPATLPQRGLLGTDIGDDESRLTTPMDTGPASVRNRFTAYPRSTNIPMVLTGDQLETFYTFYRTTLSNGALSFTWVDPQTNESATLRFKSPPRWTCVRPGLPDNRLWRAQLALEVLP